MTEGQSTVDPMFPALAGVPDGLYCADERRPWWDLRKYWSPRGWLSVDHDSRGHTNIMWTSHRDTHSALMGPAMTVVLSKSGAIIGYYESAFTMHCVASYAEDYAGPRNAKAIHAAYRMQQWLCDEVPA